MAAAGTTGGLTAGSFFSTLGGGFTTGFTGVGGFGQMMTAGLFGATGAAGTTAGLLGSGGVGLGATGMFGATANSAMASLLPGATQGVGASLSGGAIFGGGSIATPVLPGAAKATATTTMGKIGGFVKDAVGTGLKQVAVAGVVNKLTGDREEEEYYRSGSGRATSFSTNARKMVDVGQYVERYSSSSASDFSAIYGTMLNNLSYGNGSLDYAQNTQTALMSGIKVSPLQYT